MPLSLPLRLLSAAVPFQRTPLAAIQVATLAAHGTKGYFSFFRLLFVQILAKIIGTKRAPGTDLRLESFSALLVPVGRLDLAVRGMSRISNGRRTGYDENICRELCRALSAITNQVPGHAQAPLDRLAITTRTLESGSQDEGWATEPVPYSVEEHSGPTVTVRDSSSGNVSVQTWPTSLTVIPFTQHLLTILAKLAALPSTTESRHGVSVGRSLSRAHLMPTMESTDLCQILSRTPRGLITDTSQLNSLILTAYPLYLPIYQAEDAITSDRRETDRITTVVFGGKQSACGSHSAYCSWLPERSWDPARNGTASVAKTAPMPFTENMDTKVSTSMWRRFNHWLLSFERRAFGEPPPFKLVAPICNWGEQVGKNPRARGKCELDVLEASLREIERVWVMGCAEHLRGTDRGKKKLEADQKMRQKLVKIKEEIDEQKRESGSPSWIGSRMSSKIFNEERASVVVADFRESGSMFGRSSFCVIAS
ncbi:BQ5605_C029g10626 [Microbotryum silenes-dioicae]|uniref:BQ5605_C029g10626 protein n=1 Tax=Microbotryum silenes-dioicae TaxID=796604 RepID=A0A2X0MJA0_9BASI|nr:BQ5605_C029g10626 [Microbotryum silenes-dioicae]